MRDKRLQLSVFQIYTDTAIFNPAKANVSQRKQTVLKKEKFLGVFHCPPYYQVLLSSLIVRSYYQVLLSGLIVINNCIAAV